MSKKEIILASIISIIIGVNLVAGIIIKNINKEIKTTSVLAKEALDLQSAMANSLTALKKLNAGNKKIALNLQKTRKNLGKMKEIISYVEEKNKKMKIEELGIDKMEKNVVHNLPKLVALAKGVLRLEDDLLNTVNNLNESGKKAKYLEYKLLKLSKRKVNIMKNFPDIEKRFLK